MDQKLGLALGYSIPYWPAGVGNAAVAMLSDPAAVAMLVAMLGLMVAIAAVPEPTMITKVAVLVFVVVMLGVFGWDVLSTSARALAHFFEACERARTHQELREAGRQLAYEGGKPLFDVLLFILFWKGGQRYSRWRSSRAGSQPEPAGSPSTSPPLELEPTGARPAEVVLAELRARLSPEARAGLAALQRRHPPELVLQALREAQVARGSPEWFLREVAARESPVPARATPVRVRRFLVEVWAYLCRVCRLGQDAARRLWVLLLDEAAAAERYLIERSQAAREALIRAIEGGDWGGPTGPTPVLAGAGGPNVPAPAARPPRVVKTAIDDAVAMSAEEPTSGREGSPEGQPPTPPPPERAVDAPEGRPQQQRSPQPSRPPSDADLARLDAAKPASFEAVRNAREIINRHKQGQSLLARELTLAEQRLMELVKREADHSSARVDADICELLMEEYASIQQDAARVARTIETPPRAVPEYVRENRVPLARETILADTTQFEPMDASYKGARWYKGIGVRAGTISHLDTKHKGAAAEIEVFEGREGGPHLGTIDPATGEQIGGPVEGRYLRRD